jgi:hypothetical protein
MIYRYWTTEERGTAMSLAIMVGLSLSVQLLVVWGQNRKGPRSVMLKEMLIVLSGIAPGVHAMRVANGSEKSEHAPMEPEMELTFTRSIEMVLESIPGECARRGVAGSGVGCQRMEELTRVLSGCVLQLYVLLPTLKTGGFSKRAFGSIIVSALTTGFSAATISFVSSP